jgi:hypothetical protein
MPTLKQDRTVMKRHFRDMLYLGLPFLMILLLMVLGTKWLESVAVFIVGFITAVPLAVVGLVRQERRLRHFACPTCGTMLHRDPGGEDGEPITFVCTPCDTEWDTGFRVGRGD